jgi:hypothetical protein
MVLAIVLSTGAGCSTRHSPAAAPAAGHGEREALAPPIPGLLGHRDLLSLRSDQVVALDSIHQLWRSENARLTTRGASITAGSFGSSIRRVAVSPSGPEAGANHLRAARAVERILAPEQRLATCELYRSGPEPVHRVWPWCGPQKK